jgi:Ca2+-binding RTX toxin-like protein
MAKKNLSWIRSAIRPRPRDSARLRSVPLSVRPLEDRTTPAFTVTPLAGNLLLQFQGNFENDALTVSVSPDGFIRHNLVQANLASEFDMSTSAAGEQRVFFFEVIRMTLAGGLGNDLLVNDTAIRSDMLGESGNDTLVGGAANDLLVASAGADQYSGRGGIDLLDVRTSGTGITTVLLSDTSVTVGATTTADPGIETLRFFGFSTPALVDASGLTLGTVSLIGGTGDDTLWGGAGNDAIDGFLGNDDLAGNGGNDSIDAGPGNDTATGGAGHDAIIGSQGSDSITGGEGNDSLLGDLPVTSISDGSGDDTVSGGDGDDVVTGGLGNDLVDGGAGTDRLFESGVHLLRLTDTVLEADGLAIPDHGFEAVDVTGTSAADILDASEFTLGPVTLAGLAGNDTLAGGSGDDELTDGDGANSISGGAGNDTINTEGNELMVIAGNRIDAGPGDDRVAAWFGDDTIFGGDGNDDLDAGFGSDVISGGDGDDGLFGSSGDDVVSGDTGNDFVLGDESRSGFGFEPGDDTLSGGSGNDTVDAGFGNDSSSGGAGDDTLIDISVHNLRLTNAKLEVDGVTVIQPSFEMAEITGTGGNDVLDLSGATGRVILFGGGGSDTLAGGSGDDVIDGATDGAANSITGGAGNDILFGGSEGDVVDAGPGDDEITGFDGSDEIHGGPGNDTIDAGEGDNTLTGGSGDDFLMSGIGTDDLDGGSGDDIVWVINDQARGGSGTDHLVYFLTGTNAIVTNDDVIVDGLSTLPNHGFELVSLGGNEQANVLDTTAFDLGPVSVSGNGGNDIVRVGARPAEVSGGLGNDELVVVGTDGADTFTVSRSTVTVNGADVFGVFGFDRLTIDARGGIDQGTLTGSPLSIPFTAHGLEPTVSAGGNETIAVGPFTRSGSFTDIGNGQTWTATVDFGDGSGAQALTLNPDGTFTLSHTYAQAGEFRVVVQITDNEGNIGLAEFVLNVTGP